ncbi:hypothetical protein [Phreatobacter oligotrophus]|uniref:hypothetical protein n=1 Tax=Phreatobacter oligotrophus TaxID=1122261 RepID=UPI0023546C5E|nr:hypothetical protein [Phreatobacter oligotrophus]MBX9990791.1 hypothetical protein [Phreatobacter oligotrophus]
MDAASSFFQYWYFHVPNYVLALVMYACLGRFVLGLFVPPTWDNYIWRGFVWTSDLAVRPVQAITPGAVPLQVVILFAILWTLAFRIFLFFEMARWGLAPRIAG